MKIQKAFTLAETFVTLTIIGVIAALTIPSLIVKVTDDQLATKWKKTLAELSDATQKIDLNHDIDTSSHANFRDDYAEVMNFIATGDFNVLLGSVITYKHYKGNGFWTTSSGANYAAGQLPSGAVIGFYRYSTTCASTSTAVLGGGTLTGVCAELDIDVNGDDPPNMVGKDYNMAWLIKKDGVYQVISGGTNNDGTSCVAGSSTWRNSLGCAVYPLKGTPLP
ncbi:MAG: hypothetical protein A2287_06525 [Candidatus Melainabacteria bacterium RIFOXYA12_FULL_32_12]|nr:MAG: hypothetical protein A2255_06040 [Candidatus Melainabacteria bacterium RIFOXYA2_FULL_32_9]OGI26867.1 MAG: hypothetical protein A2287_06525 [Candidatus Melainabacteria bacterium RIFOXYA12_FULL_32_12]